MSKRVCYQGETLSLSEVARQSGVSVSVLRSRMANGETIDQAALPRETVRMVEVAGERLTVPGAAQKLGVSVPCLFRRVSRGETWEQACSYGNQRRKRSVAYWARSPELLALVDGAKLLAIVKCWRPTDAFVWDWQTTASIGGRAYTESEARAAAAKACGVEVPDGDL